MRWRIPLIASKQIKAVLIFLAFICASPAYSQEVNTTIDELDADNLPTESVVPSVDSNLVVRNRLVSFAKRWDLNLSYGLVIDEMFFDNKFFSLATYYNFTEDTAFGIKYLSRSAGQSDYAKQFAQTLSNVNLSKSPAPSSLTALSYRYSFLYGKVSFSRDLVLPMSLDTQVDAGMHKVGTQSLPYTAAGVSQKFFLGKNWGIGLTYKIMFYQTVDPVSAFVGTGFQPNESDFTKKLQISQAFGLDLSYLF